MEILKNKKAFICDMDGVIYHGNKLLKGVKEFVQWLKDSDKKFLFLTNSGSKTPRELREKLLRMDLDIPEKNFYTSALSTAAFLSRQKPGGSAYVIGEAGLMNALYNVGFSMNDTNPDYVVVSETSNYNITTLQKAVELVLNGAKLIGTNRDLSDPWDNGIIPATGSLIAPIELTTKHNAYFMGKPNPLMMRTAIKILETQRENTVIIGDRMDTDIIAGIESEITTVLVLSGVTTMESMKKYAFSPDYTINGVGDLAT